MGERFRRFFYTHGGMGNLSDLLRRVADGDRGAANELAVRYEAPVRDAIHRRLGASLRVRVDTDDIFQSTILAAVQELPHFEFVNEKAFLAWLTTIAEWRVRKAARHHRAGKRDLRQERPLGVEHDVAGSGTTPTQGAVRREIAAGIRQAVTRLAPPDRQIVELHSFEGLGFREVAERLGLPDKDVARYRFRRALKSIGAILRQ